MPVRKEGGRERGRERKRERKKERKKRGEGGRSEDKVEVTGPGVSSLCLLCLSLGELQRASLNVATNDGRAVVCEPHPEHSSSF